MGKKFAASVFISVAIVVAACATSVAGPIFVATAQNLKGMLFTGYGPTPDHAGQMALSGCSLHSFLPVTCKIVELHAEVPPPPPPQMMRPMPRYKKSYRSAVPVRKPVKSASRETLDKPVNKPRAVEQSRRPDPPERIPQRTPERTTASVPAVTQAKAENRPGMQETSPGGTNDAKYQWGKPLHSN